METKKVVCPDCGSFASFMEEYKGLDVYLCDVCENRFGFIDENQLKVA